jgi:hypothetical protein
MIELRQDALVFRFAEVHPSASVTVDFQRTLRIPDDGRTYHLPPGLGRFPLRHVDDFASRVPADWVAHGGVMLPMYQAEAMWLNFRCGFDSEREASYPFALKVATGKVNAVTGQSWSESLHRRPQDYLVVPTQPWLDGYCVEKGIIRQFVAMPLGAGYSAEEQLTGEAEHGGLQIVAYPMKREAFERRFRKARRRGMLMDTASADLCCSAPAGAAMGLAPGGQMRQEIYDDPYKLDEWDTQHASRCFVHIANSQMWRAMTGQAPPSKPPTAADYTRAGLPWFDYYSDAAAVEGSPVLAKLKSVLHLGHEKAEHPLPENPSVTAKKVISLRQGLAPGQVREGSF